MGSASSLFELRIDPVHHLPELAPLDLDALGEAVRATGPAELFARLSGRFLGPELAAAAEVAVGGAT